MKDTFSLTVPKNVEVVYLPEHTSHLEEYARAYYEDGYGKREVESIVLGLLWSSLYLGEYRPKKTSHR